MLFYIFSSLNAIAETTFFCLGSIAFLIYIKKNK